MRMINSATLLSQVHSVNNTIEIIVQGGLAPDLTFNLGKRETYRLKSIFFSISSLFRICLRASTHLLKLNLVFIMLLHIFLLLIKSRLQVFLRET